LTEYTNEGFAAETESFPGKIAIVTDYPSINSDDFHSLDRLVEKYGADKIFHLTRPENFVAEQGKMIDAVTGLAEYGEIKVLIINQTVPGTNAAIDRLKKIRDDMFIIFCGFIHEPDASKRANLILTPDQLGMGSAMVKQAKKQGAKVFLHYSFPRHMSQAILSKRCELIRKACEAEGITFVSATAPDPTGETGVAGAKQFILEDVPKLVARYGEDTAFFCTNCTLQVPLIKAVVSCHAIYPQPCCPSPFHGFPEALGIKTSENHADLNYVIDEVCRIVAEKNMTDRLSTWPVSASTMFVNAGAEYAIRWLKGLVPKNEIDNRVLEDCLSAYVREAIGEGVEVEMESYSENGITYDNFKMLLMSYLDF